MTKQGLSNDLWERFPISGNRLSEKKRGKTKS
jgi:hypothetical protein